MLASLSPRRAGEKDTHFPDEPNLSFAEPAIAINSLVPILRPFLGSPFAVKFSRDSQNHDAGENRIAARGLVNLPRPCVQAGFKPRKQIMDHTPQHHQHHAKEREGEKKEWQEHIREISGKRHGVHPAWYVVVAAVMVGAATFAWTFPIW